MWKYIEKPDTYEESQLLIQSNMRQPRFNKIKYVTHNIFTTLKQLFQINPNTQKQAYKNIFCLWHWHYMLLFTNFFSNYFQCFLSISGNYLTYFAVLFISQLLFIEHFLNAFHFLYWDLANYPVRHSFQMTFKGL